MVFPRIEFSLLLFKELPSKKLLHNYANNKAIFSIDKNPLTVFTNFQTHLNLMPQWYTKRRIKPNPNKSIHTTLILCHFVCPKVYLHNVSIPTSNTIRYLTQLG